MIFAVPAEASASGVNTARDTQMRPLTSGRGTLTWMMSLTSRSKVGSALRSLRQLQVRRGRYDTCLSSHRWPRSRVHPCRSPRLRSRSAPRDGVRRACNNASPFSIEKGDFSFTRHGRAQLFKRLMMDFDQRHTHAIAVTSLAASRLVAARVHSWAPSGMFPHVIQDVICHDAVETPGRSRHRFNFAPAQTK